MTPNKYIKEVEETLSRLSTSTAAEREQIRRYIGTELSVLGLSSQVQKQACKTGFSFYHTDKEMTFRTFDGIYRLGKTHEAKNQAFIFLDQNYRHVVATTQMSVLPSWVKGVDNWAHSDYLSKFLSRLLEHPDTGSAMMKQLKAWNSSANPWERRQSLVSLYYYARTKTNHVDFKTTTKLVSPLLEDKAYYVQKAVGWTLRECYNVYKREAFDFMEAQHRRISSVAFTAAIEKMSDKEKNHLKQLRRKRA